jgi:hypothetical protein
MCDVAERFGGRSSSRGSEHDFSACTLAKVFRRRSEPSLRFDTGRCMHQKKSLAVTVRVEPSAMMKVCNTPGAAIGKAIKSVSGVA